MSKWPSVLSVVLAAVVHAALMGGSARAFDLTFSSGQFVITPTFSDVRDFEFLVRIEEPLRTGTFENPVLSLVDYMVFGELAPGTPSGFSFFGLMRTMGGLEFYNQGSSLNFEITADADLTDGLQASELTGMDPVFVFNGREVGTGRYHPPLFQLNSDGTGSIRNSNNMGGVNPATGMVVDVDFGDEYISELSFVPSALTLVESNGVNGDFNNDGSWDCLDIDALVAEIVAGTSSLSFDMNFDGTVDEADLTTPGTGWLTVGGRNNSAATGDNPFLVGDITLDGVVDGLDFIAWNENRFSTAPGWCNGDLNADGIVDSEDFVLWNEHKFTSSSGSAPAVPEPTSAWLWCSGVIAVLARGRLRGK